MVVQFSLKLTQKPNWKYLYGVNGSRIDVSQIDLNTTLVILTYRYLKYEQAQKTLYVDSLEGLSAIC